MNNSILCQASAGSRSILLFSANRIGRCPGKRIDSRSWRDEVPNLLDQGINIKGLNEGATPLAP